VLARAESRSPAKSRIPSVSGYHEKPSMSAPVVERFDNALPDERIQEATLRPGQVGPPHGYTIFLKLILFIIILWVKKNIFFSQFLLYVYFQKYCIMLRMLNVFGQPTFLWIRLLLMSASLKKKYNKKKQKCVDLKLLFQQVYINLKFCFKIFISFHLFCIFYFLNSSAGISSAPLVRSPAGSFFFLGIQIYCRGRMNSIGRRYSSSAVLFSGPPFFGQPPDFLDSKSRNLG